MIEKQYKIDKKTKLVMYIDFKGGHLGLTTPSNLSPGIFRKVLISTIIMLRKTICNMKIIGFKETHNMLI